VVTNISEVLDAAELEGLALDRLPTGYTASIMLAIGDWSPREFAASASGAIAKCLRLHAPPKAIPAAPPLAKMAPPLAKMAPSLAPPPY
jgi:hypothetical protein